MPCSLKEEKRGFLVTFSGFTPPVEALDLYRRLADHTVSRKDSYQIQDLTEIDSDTAFTMSDTIIEDVACRLRDIYGGHGPRIYLAMVTQSAKVRDFLSAVWNAGAHPLHHKIRFFPNVQAARAWVNTEMGITD